MSESTPRGGAHDAEIIPFNYYKDRFEYDDESSEDEVLQAAHDAATEAIGFEVRSQWLGKDADIPKGDWLIPGVIPAGRLGLLTGEAGMGKSMIALQVCAALASGNEQWMEGTGIKLDGDPKRVVYACYEDEWFRSEQRVRSMGYEDPASSFGDRFHELRGMGELWGPSKRGSQHTSTLGVARAALDEIKEHCEATNADMLVVDPLGAAFTSNEVDRGLVTMFCRDLDLWGQTHGVAIMLVAHPPKSGGAYSGSTAWIGCVRWLLHAHRGELQSASGRGDARVPAKVWPCLQLAKANYARSHPTPRWWLDTDAPGEGRELRVVSKQQALELHSRRAADGHGEPPIDAYEGDGREYR